MASASLARWQSARAQRLDNLVAAHHAVAGGTRGRKWLTAEVNHALIVRLASEFQGFCRDLHDEAIEAVLDAKLTTDHSMNSIVRALLENNRRLDSGNANWGNIGSDYARLGISMATELRTARPAKYSTWMQTLDRLNAARNAIAHDNRDELAACEALQPLTFRTFSQWRSRLTLIVVAVDAVTGRYLTDLNGTSPW